MKLKKLDALHTQLSILINSVGEEAQDLMDTWEDKSEQYQATERGEAERDAVEELQGEVEEIELAINSLGEKLEEHRNG